MAIMPIATTDEQRALADAIRSWGAGAGPVAASRAQERDPSAWRAHWDELAAFGTFAVAVPESCGGAGGTLADLAVVLEQTAQLLVPGPVLPTALAAVVLARAGAMQLCAAVAEGALPVGIAFGRSDTVATSAVDGTLHVTGHGGLVLGAGAGTAVLFGVATDNGETWVLLPPDTPGLKLVEHEAGDFSRALASLHLERVEVRADQQLTGIDRAFVTDLAAALCAAEAAGVAAWCLQTAVDHAKVREQFGKPIGGFQAIKHLCAEMLCRVELAGAVAWDAAHAAHDDEQRPIAAAVAASIALDAAVDTAKDVIQVLGGIGFTWEHDAHLYLRRALATRALLGGSSRWRRRTAELTISGHRRDLTIDLDLVDDGVRAQFRAVAEGVAARPAAEHRVALAESGYLAPHWPRPYGLDASPAEQLVIDEELHRAGVTRPDLVIAGWAVPTIMQYGTAEQVERFVAPTLRGDIVWCQLFSEPGAGSDLASLRTRADKVADGGPPANEGMAGGGGGGWRLTGQKVWTSLACSADWAICLARTDAAAPKHKGISYFLVDMRSPGIEVRPLREITGEAVFNEVFLDDVLVPDEALVGELHNGWQLARATLVNERIAMSGGSALGEAVERLLDLADDRRSLDDPAVLERLGMLIAEGCACSLLDLRSTLRRLGGRDAGSESSVRKLVGVRHRQAVAEASLDVLGPDGALDCEQLRQFLMTRCLTIAGGTTQVLLTLAGERLLGLPRG